MSRGSLSLLLKNAPGVAVVVALAFNISFRFVASTFSLRFRLLVAALVAASGFSFSFRFVASAFDLSFRLLVAALAAASGFICKLFKCGCSCRLLLLKNVPRSRVALAEECPRGCGCCSFSF